LRRFSRDHVHLRKVRRCSKIRKAKKFGGVLPAVQDGLSTLKDIAAFMAAGVLLIQEK
jgi:hypothetical protein